jgi:AbrB family looped-hinge helix DNA binding protein
MVEPEQLIKITSVGTISIPKDFRRYLDLQKGDYVKVLVEGDRLIVKKATIS